MDENELEVETDGPPEPAMHRHLAEVFGDARPALEAAPEPPPPAPVKAATPKPVMTPADLARLAALEAQREGLEAELRAATEERRRCAEAIAEVEPALKTARVRAILDRSPATLAAVEENQALLAKAIATETAAVERSVDLAGAISILAHEIDALHRQAATAEEQRLLAAVEATRDADEALLVEIADRLALLSALHGRVGGGLVKLVQGNSRLALRLSGEAIQERRPALKARLLAREVNHEG